MCCNDVLRVLRGPVSLMFSLPVPDVLVLPPFGATFGRLGTGICSSQLSATACVALHGALGLAPARLLRT